MQSTRQLTRSTSVERSPRVVQLEGMFDVPPQKRSERTWQVNLPIEDRDWSIGMIVGPSGSGKSTVLEECFGKPPAYEWSPRLAVVDGFPEAMPITEVTGALSAVGFSSPPSWLRPYSTLSNGEQFRASLARVLVEAPALAVVDEFTSVVDRTVAQVASAAVSKYVRRSGKRLVAASCHYDVIDWLQPDWIFDTQAGEFTWRSVQPRPRVNLEVYRTTTAAWPIFHHHHYLSGELHKAARCYVALVRGRPAAFTSVIHYPHPKVRNLWKEHRTVCLPDFQGIGIGNALSELVASAFRAQGYRFRSVTSSPAMVRHRARSPLWRMDRPPSMVKPVSRRSTLRGRIVSSTERLTASFEYVGPPCSVEQLEALSG